MAHSTAFSVVDVVAVVLYTNICLQCSKNFLAVVEFA